MITTLYVDGGVIGHNPSGIGGTWAWCLVDNSDVRIASGSGYVTPAQAAMPGITNNFTEMLALIYGLERLPVGFKGTVCSDSEITLGRAFWGWQWNGIPDWMHRRYQAARKRLPNYDSLTPLLLDGHPTAQQLADKIGKRGHPVSIHNVWCDRACGEAGQQYLQMMEPQR